MRLPLIALCLFLAVCAHAQILLKPKGYQAEQLLVKSLKADVTIEEQIATTKLEIVFRNALAERIEADFFYTLPPDTLVTAFAYWYGDERVVAHVVEKERAAAIYKHITSRMRDPALIELVGKRTFRARIFPIMPNADLKVEMTLIQVLPSTGEGYSYMLPLQTPRGQYLESVDVNVQVKRDAWVSSVLNNFGLAEATEGDVAHLTFTAKDYRPQKDLRVTVQRRSRPLQASLFSARSGGRDGFFALTLTPGRAVQAPKLQFLGIKVYDIRPAKLLSVKAGQKLTIYGRYGGADATRVILSGKGYQEEAEVWFSDKAIPNNAATKLWAAAEIERLSTSDKNRNAVVALSMRHTIPSKFTSWLAIPKEERERYEREIARANVEALASQLALEVSKGRENGAVAQSLHARLKNAAAKAGIDPKSAVRDKVEDYAMGVARDLADEIAAGRTNGKRAKALSARLTKLEKYAGLDRRWLNQVASSDAAWEQAEELAKEISLGRGSGSRARVLRARLRDYARQFNQSLSWLISQNIENYLDTLAMQLVEEERSERPDPKRIAALQTQVARLEKEAGAKPGEARQKRLHSYLHREIRSVSAKLSHEINAGRAQGPTAKALRARMRGMVEEHRPDEILVDYHVLEEAGIRTTISVYSDEVLAGRPNSERAQQALREVDKLAEDYGVNPKWVLKQGIEVLHGHLGTQLDYQRESTIRDRALMESLEQKIKLLSEAIGKKPDEFAWWYRHMFEDHPEDIVRYELIQERRKDNPDPARVKDLEARLEKYTAARRRWQPTYAKDRNERIAVEVELDKLQVMAMTPELQQRKATLEARQQELRARMGDPLISVEAPLDARQVVALMPDGIVKQLEINPANKKWEGRFDIPTYAPEGEYVVRIIMVLRDGTRREQTIKFHVDVTAPKATATVKWVDGKLRIDAASSPDTDRVEAVLPWGEMIKLERTGQAGVFFAVVQPPADYTQAAPVVELIVTDKAHNRTALKITAGNP